MDWKIIAVFLVLALSAFYVSGMTTGSFLSGEPRACIKGHCFDVEVAKTAGEKSRGLMLREQLDLNHGMVFLYDEEAVRPFWMKNTLIPLDIIWISGDMEITYIARDAQPCRAEPCDIINPGVRSMHVLEINGGLSDRLGFSEGERVLFYGIPE